MQYNLIPQLSSIKLLLACASLAGLLGGCAINPVSGQNDFVLMSENQEVSAGKKYHQSILQQYRPYENPELQKYVESVGRELAEKSHRSHLTFHFTVLDSPQVNAFALPGGYIYITRGIMAYLNSEAELAGVLGHEIGHVTARHSVRQQSTAQVTGLLGGLLNAATGQDVNRGLFSQVGFALSKGYGRNHELEADRLGAEYLARVGYSPDNMIEVVGVLKDQELFEKERAQKEGRQAQSYHGLFASHPENDKRLREVIDAAKKYQTGQNRDPGAERYLRAIDGLPFGPSAEDGVVRGSYFYHAELDAKLRAPDDWLIDNLPDRLVFSAPDQKAFMQVRLVPREGAESASDFLLNHLKRDSLGDTRAMASGDMQGYSGVAVVDNTPYGQRKVRYSVWLRGEYAWIFAATTQEHTDLELLDPTLDRSVKSLAGLTAKDRKLARPLRLKIVRTKPGIRYQALAKDSTLGDYAVSQLRLLNGAYPDGEPQENTLIKVVD